MRDAIGGDEVFVLKWKLLSNQSDNRLELEICEVLEMRVEWVAGSVELSRSNGLEVDWQSGAIWSRRLGFIVLNGSRG